jgi:phenylpropionate dioxygenase-like ring-hydroxylating dioxygenase large terminal subunit
MDGRLAGAPAMEKTQGFSRENYGLVPIRLETWEGFIFVTFDPNAESLTSYLGDLPEKMESYSFSDMVCVRRKAYDIEANWKLYMENIEFYHTAMVHGDSIGRQIGDTEDTRGQWEALYMPSKTPIAILPGETSSFPYIKTLKGKAAEGTYFPLLYPNTMFMFATTQDCMWWISLYPKGPLRSRIVLGFCFPKTTVARSDFEQVVQKYYKRWDYSIPQDDRAVEKQQIGLHSRARPPGRYAWVEPLVYRFDNWVLDRVLD